MERAAKLASAIPGVSELRLDESIRQFGGPLKEQLDLAVEAGNLMRFNCRVCISALLPSRAVTSGVDTAGHACELEGALDQCSSANVHDRVRAAGHGCGESGERRQGCCTATAGWVGELSARNWSRSGCTHSRI
eukprot:1152791-Pelagomonas_calceolata.AAC.8